MPVFHDYSEQLGYIIHLLKTLVKQGAIHMAREQEMLDELSAETSAGQAVVKLLDEVVAMLAAAGTDQAKIDQALGMVKANKEMWAAAVVKNTPSEDPGAEHAAGM